MVSVLQKVLGDPNEKALKKLTPFVREINELEPEFQKMTDEELLGMTGEFRSRLAAGEGLENIMAEAFATAIRAGQLAADADPMPPRDMAAPSTPLIGKAFLE